MTTVGRWSPNKVRARVLDGTWLAATPETDGDATDAALMMVPTSIAYTGTSATTTASGSVEFTACSSLSLNGVFSADYDNYMVVSRMVSTVDGSNIRARLRLSGADASTTDYVFQTLTASNTTVTGSRATSQNLGLLGSVDDGQRSGIINYFYGPALAQPTACRNNGVSGFGDANIADFAWTHSVSTAYDGFTIFPGSGSITGLISVYGIRGA